MRYLLLAAIFISSIDCYAHSGGADKNGCHHDRKIGGYHCH
ncbi:YHYH domain-containing protein [Methylophilus sp. 14]|nr:YHYH domain-containing protein [Methylophilus sp. 14]